MLFFTPFICLTLQRAVQLYELLICLLVLQQKKSNREKLRTRRKCCSKSVGCEENEKSCKKWGIIEKKWKNVRGNGKMEKLRCVCKLVFISFANSIADCLSRIFSLEDLPMKLLEMMILNFFFLISR